MKHPAISPNVSALPDAEPGATAGNCGRPVQATHECTKMGLPPGRSRGRTSRLDAALKVAVLSACATALLGACSTTGVNFGVTVPIGPHIGVGVGVGSDGRVTTGVGVSAGGGRIGVSTSGRLPAASAAVPAQAAASRP